MLFFLDLFIAFCKLLGNGFKFLDRMKARELLVHHEDGRLWPRLHDHLGVEVLDDDADHQNVFLDHDVHSEALVSFFLEYFHSTHDIGPNGFKVVACNRFDSAVLDPLLLAYTFGIDEEDLERGAPVV